MFKKPFELFGWIVVGLFCFWFAGIIFTNDSCTRVYRSGWPAWYSFTFGEFVSQNWTDSESKFLLLRYKVKSTKVLQAFFQTTLYGDSIKCKL